MSRFEGALDSSRPFIIVGIQAAPGQFRLGQGVARVQGLALVDTGSETSGITKSAADRLALTSNVAIPVVTSLGEKELPAYFIRIDIEFNMPAESRTVEHSLEVFEDQSDWKAQMSGFEIIALIGMDVLKGCRLSVDGPADTFELELR